MKKTYSLLLTCLLLNSCTKDPGLLSPTNAYSTASYPATVNDLNSILASSYSALRDPGLLGFNLLPKGLSNATHVANSAYSGDQSWNEMAANNLTIGNARSSDAWTALYTGIKNCNVTIAGGKFYNSTNAKPTDAPNVNAILGQAYFLRAYYYLMLECLFGESYLKANGTNGDKMGVPLYTSVPTSLASTQVARSSVKDVWTLIESDLKQAATLLKGKVWTGNDIGRVTEWSAKALLGKAYVYTEDWATAKPVLLDVIQNSGKSLMPYAKYQNAFNGNSANEFNEESLFELNVDPDPQGGYGIYSASANATTINGLIWSPFVLGGNGTEVSAFPLGYGNEFLHDQNVRRFGYPLGTQYTLVSNPSYKASVGPRYNNPQLIIDPVYKQAALAVRTNKTADPRLFVNGVQPWIDSLKFDGDNYAPAAKPNFYAGNVNVFGWGVKKYSPITYNENVGLGKGVADAWNYYLLRLADVYLLYAEASARSGDNATALDYLNRVKRRAYGYSTTATSPVDYKSLTDQTAAINDPVLGKNPLYYERWAELFNEGSWWFDVCRWRLGPSEAAYYQTAINVAAPLAFDEAKAYSWPIPISEINANGQIKGNPGY